MKYTPAMTSLERVRSVIENGSADQLPLMPITMQFAADRIGKPYLQYATDHRVLVAAQLRVAEEFAFDYVSAISDPAREAADCGATVIFQPNSPPAIDEANARLAEKTSLMHLKYPDPLGGGRMHDRVLAVEQLARAVGKDKIVEGWVEGPCAEAADLRGINTLMLDFYDDEQFVTDLLEFILKMELAFAKAQVQAGATLIGVGDAAASLVGPEIYERFIYPYEERLIQGIQEMGAMVRLHICGNTTPILDLLGKLKPEIIDLDYLASIEAARKVMPGRQVLLGNIDPVRTLRDGTPESVYAAIGHCHLQAGPHYIVGAGCEVPRETKPENVRALARYAREHQP